MSKFGSNGSQIQGLFAFERVYWKISIERRERDKTNIVFFHSDFTYSPTKVIFSAHNIC